MWLPHALLQVTVPLLFLGPRLTVDAVSIGTILDQDKAIRGW